MYGHSFQFIKDCIDKFSKVVQCVLGKGSVYYSVNMASVNSTVVKKDVRQTAIQNQAIAHEIQEKLL